MSTTTTGPAIHCAHDALVPIADLRPHPRNPNTHPRRQIELLADIITRQGWRAPVTVSRRSGFIVAGHGRVLAAQAAGLDVAPVDYQDFATEAAELEHLLADNRIAELAEIDEDTVRAILAEAGLDASLTGYEGDALSALLAADPVADLAADIATEAEHQPEEGPDPEAMTASFTAHIDRLAKQHPERLRGALAVIVPAGKGGTADCLVLSDPACADAARELRRLAEAGHPSPAAALLAALLPMGPTP